MNTTTKTEGMTDTKILETLRAQADETGDRRMSYLCDQALDGNKAARAQIKAICAESANIAASY